MKTKTGYAEGRIPNWELNELGNGTVEIRAVYSGTIDEAEDLLLDVITWVEVPAQSRTEILAAMKGGSN